MSDSGEKTFEPTPSRLARARREGNVARAGELSANVAFPAAAICTVAILPTLAACARSAIVAAASGVAPWPACTTLLAFAMIPLAAAALAGACAGVAQTGGLHVVAPAMKFERVNPVEGLKRMLSRETVGHMLRAALAFVCTALAVVASSSALGTVLRGASIVADAGAAWEAVVRIVASAAAVGLAFAAVEYAAARGAWLRKLRMSFAEFKREVREQDGDPLLRGRRRSLHRTLSKSDVRRVREAAFVICNPTHVAIALAYRPPDEPIPRVLVRAVDAAALRVRALAVESAIPIVENVELARALYAKARAGEPIPHTHYVAVAEVVAALMRSGAIAS